MAQGSAAIERKIQMIAGELRSREWIELLLHRDETERLPECARLGGLAYRDAVLRKVTARRRLVYIERRRRERARFDEDHSLAGRIAERRKVEYVGRDLKLVEIDA